MGGLRSPQSSRGSATPNVGLLLPLLLLVVALGGLQFLLAGRLPTLLPPGLPSSRAVAVTPPSQLQPNRESQPSSFDGAVSLQHVLLHLTAADAATTLSNVIPSPIDFHSLDIAACRPDDSVVWQEWKDCIEQVLAFAGPASSASAFDTFIDSEALRLPWSVDVQEEETGTAVLLDFRALPHQLRFTVRNAMENLPVQWRIQVVGGPAVCRLAQRLFPAEVAAGKVVCTDLGVGDSMRQDLISAILTDMDLLYSKLLGDTWLFIQYDSAICSPQRYRLGHFLQAGIGWWGAPWAHWHRWPAIGGNGGFSLRRRLFITTMLSTSRWVDQAGSGNEDWWFCQRAADVYPWLLARHDRRLLPAPGEEALAFSVEMLFHEQPFGVHQYWTNLHPPNATAFRALLRNCPEALRILPGDILTRRPDWRGVLCDLRPSLAGCSGARVSTGPLLGRRRREAKQGKQQQQQQQQRGVHHAYPSDLMLTFHRG